MSSLSFGEATTVTLFEALTPTVATYTRGSAVSDQSAGAPFVVTLPISNHGST